jgi:spermidine synthase
LGIGTSTQAFQQHGLHTTIIEIDPVVYNYTRTFFDLAAPDAVFLEDARGWVKRKAKELKEAEESSRLKEQFDYVVHDCFSGGGVPSHLYTMEFWADLKEIMKPDGVVAVVCLLSNVTHHSS